MNASFLPPARWIAAALILVEAILPLSAHAYGLSDSAESMVQAKLIEPLKKKEDGRSRFSRAELPPQARRIRILEDAPHTDAEGRSFVYFAVDESRASIVARNENPEAGWFRDAIVGCVYPESGSVLVRRGEVYYASTVLLGQVTPTAPDGVCRPR